MKKYKALKMAIVTSLVCFGMSAYAEETAVEKVEAAGNQAVDSAKKAYRKADDKTCEMVNGKMECTMKKIKNEAKNISDKADSKTKEMKNKVD